MKGFFITGTDTGVGKTFVTAGIARQAVERGMRVFAFKPIETGCTGLGEDQKILCEVRVKEMHVERKIRLVYPTRRALSHSAKAFLELVG